MSMTLKILVVLGSYLTVGFLLTCIRAWLGGKHRIIHGGARNSDCSHYACDSMFLDTMGFTLAFWPVLVPIQVCVAIARKVFEAPYLRSLPPVNSLSKEEEANRELIDAVLALGSVKHFTGSGEYDGKWNRLHKAMTVVQEIRKIKQT